jgi:phage-related minor tail protein
MELSKYITEEVAKLHKVTTLKEELKKINEKLDLLKEDSEDEQTEEKSYQSNVYESYRKDLEEIVVSLAEACNKLESTALKQESHIKKIPEVSDRINEGKSQKQIILDIFKDVKKAKIAAERKLYEMQ